MKTLKQPKEHGYEFITMISRDCNLGSKGEIYTKHFIYKAALMKANEHLGFLQVLDIDSAILQEKQR